MKPDEPRSPAEAPPAAESDAPQVPGFRTWRGVYAFVLGALVAYIVAFAVLPRLFR